MLSTRDRRLLLEVLRPPLGFRLDRAVGTSFSLDLLALLATPLAFTFFDWEQQDGRVTADPVALLQALRRYSSRIHLFCQAGRIRVPRPDQTLLAYLEPAVIETQARHREGIFHPKAWVLRYVADEGPVRYRVLCLSRNLTFDGSWDTALVLDGEVSGDPPQGDANRGLVRFLAGLPELSLRPLAAEAAGAIDQMTSELPAVVFELPEGFESYEFHPLGVDGESQWPFPDSRRPMAVVSPFLSEGFFERLLRDASIDVLISLPESLAALSPRVLDRCGHSYVLSQAAALDARAGDSETEEEEVTGDEEDGGLAGLHAKLYVMDDGWRARVWTGSANATSAAFERNVELLVELRGTKRLCGIDALLGSDDAKDAFRSLLQTYRPEEHEPVDAEQQRRKRALDRARLAVARAGYRVRVEDRGEDELALVLKCEEGMSERAAGLAVTVWPSSLPQENAIAAPLEAGQSCRFAPVSLEAVTSFFAFRLDLADGDESVRFLLNLPLENVPAEREQRVLRSLIRDRQQVIRLLLLLLAEEGFDVQGLVGDGGGGVYDFFHRRIGLDGSGLLEALLHALERNPAQLDEVNRLIEELAGSAEGRELLPEGFDQIWGPVWQVRGELD